MQNYEKSSPMCLAAWQVSLAGCILHSGSEVPGSNHVVFEQRKSHEGLAKRPFLLGMTFDVSMKFTCRLRAWTKDDNTILYQDYEIVIPNVEHYPVDCLNLHIKRKNCSR